MNGINKVIGIGLPKTGTSSLAAALTNNGVPTIHFGNVECEEIYQKLPKGIYKYNVLERYKGITNAFDTVFPQIDKEYPNSVFIYTVRNKKEWMVSIEKHWERMMNNPNADPMSMSHHLITYGSYLFNKDRFSFVYDNHARLVKDFFKSRQNDLLTIDITKDRGYVYKICDFLNIPVINNVPLHYNRGKG